MDEESETILARNEISCVLALLNSSHLYQLTMLISYLSNGYSKFKVVQIYFALNVIF
jgi:hypothetical protein